MYKIDNDVTVEQTGAVTRLQTGGKATSSCIPDGQKAGVQVRVDSPIQRVSLQAGKLSHEERPRVNATSGDIARDLQRVNPDSVTVTARSPGGNPRRASDIQPNDLVRVGGMELQAKQAEAMGLIMKSPAGGYEDVG